MEDVLESKDMVKGVAETGWYKHSRQLLETAIAGRSIKSMVCLGIGSMEAEKRSLDQYEVAVLLAEHFKIEKSSVTVYDPCMSPHDKQLVENQGFRIGNNELDFDPGTDAEAILLFMPGISSTVIKDMLSFTMKARSLENVIWLGARLSYYACMAKREVTPGKFPIFEEKVRWLDEFFKSQELIELSCEEDEIATSRHALTKQVVITFAGRK